MSYLVVVFSSRNDTIKFYNILKNYSGFASIINTPHSLSRSCGISIKIGNNLLYIAQNILSTNKFLSFKGIFEMNISNQNALPNKIY
jgi:hypothetical protein